MFTTKMNNRIIAAWNNRCELEKLRKSLDCTDIAVFIYPQARTELIHRIELRLAEI